MRRRATGEPPLPPRVRRLFRLPLATAARVASEVDEEVAFHLEMRAAELRAAGLSPEEAAAEARRRFGDAEELRRHAVAASLAGRVRTGMWEWVTGWRQDLGFALRQIGRAPWFAVVTVLLLALGIGASTATFSVVDHLLLDPLPFRDGSRMVELLEAPSGKEPAFMVMPDARLVAAWRAHAHTLAEITTASPSPMAIRERGGGSDVVHGAAIEPNLFEFLHVRPALGRSFTADDARAGVPNVAVISYGLWQQRYGGRTDVLGRTIDIDSAPRTIIGVAPRGLAIPFDDDFPPSVWTPLPTSLPDTFPVVAIGKLQPGISARAATKELAAIAAGLAPERMRMPHPGAKAMRARDFVGASYRRGVLTIFGAVGIVLLIACANVANLLLVRAWGRRREFAIRTALGARRGRLGRQVLTESAVLALSAGAFGLIAAWGMLSLVGASHPTALEGLDHARIDIPVLSWASAITVLAGLLFGAAPAAFAGAAGVGDALRSGARGASGGAGSRSARGAFVIAEIALSVVLLVGGGLLLRSFRALEHVPVGYDPHGLVTVGVRMPPNVPVARRVAALQLARLRAQATPGVRDAALAMGLPPGSGIMTASDVQREGIAAGTAPPFGAAALDFVQPGFFHLLGIPLRGRTFSGDSNAVQSGPSHEVILNEAAARRLWPGRDAVGEHLRFNAHAPWATVVGVAGNVTMPGKHGDRYDLQVYYPQNAMFPGAAIVLRTQLPLAALAPSLRHVLSTVDPQLTVTGIKSAESELRAHLAGPRFATRLAGAFALAALLMSAVGLYGVIAYAVSLRTHEMGVRVALGARPTDVARLVVAEGARLALAGTVLGLAAAAIAARAIRGFLFGVGSGDPITWVTVVALLGGLVLVASYLPARRAMRVDPARALAAD